MTPGILDDYPGVPPQADRATQDANTRARDLYLTCCQGLVDHLRESLAELARANTAAEGDIESESQLLRLQREVLSLRAVGNVLTGHRNIILSEAVGGASRALGALEHMAKHGPEIEPRYKIEIERTLLEALARLHGLEGPSPMEVRVLRGQLPPHATIYQTTTDDRDSIVTVDTDIPDVEGWGTVGFELANEPADRRPLFVLLAAPPAEATEPAEEGGAS